MSLQPDPQEMIRYFSDFLTEINLIIHNIKQYTYEMVGVCMPNTSLLTVYESIASIISNTHKTFDNLKRIESIMSGMVKSRNMQKIEVSPTTPIGKIRSKSAENQIFFYPSHPRKVNQVKPSINLTSTDSRTIKKSDLLQNISVKQGDQNKNQKQTVREKFDSDRSEDEKTVKMFTERGIQLKNGSFQSLKDWKKVISERINALIGNNRASMSKIIDRNMQCIRLVRSVRKDFKLK